MDNHDALHDALGEGSVVQKDVVVPGDNFVLSRKRLGLRAGRLYASLLFGASITSSPVAVSQVTIGALSSTFSRIII